jgi:hypothetical protein
VKKERAIDITFDQLGFRQTTPLNKPKGGNSGVAFMIFTDRAAQQVKPKN